MSVSVQIIVALLITSVLSAIGAFFLFIGQKKLENLVEYMISLSAGTIFGGVFIHLIYRIANSTGYSRETGLLVMSGILLSLILERTIHWHCHDQADHAEPFSYVLLVGDGVHNILDGILIATSFLASVPAGIASTIAIGAHKIPKEVGDFGVLIDAGFSKKKAILANILISLFMFLGALIVLGLSSIIGNLVGILLPLVIGNFIYIAGSDLIPRFKDSNTHILPHILIFTAGALIMYSIPYLKQIIL